MTIGILTIELFISNSNSLKHKRTVIKSLKDRLRENFNVSVAEVDSRDKWQKTTFGAVTVGSDKKYVNGVLDKMVDFIERSGDIQVLNYGIELL